MKQRIKQSFICQDIKQYQTNQTLVDTHVPTVGDVAVFEVLSIGKHKTIQGTDKRLVTILPGDRIMAAFGTRYATAQFEGYVPGGICPEYHILGAGGTVGLVASSHSRFASAGPTTLKLVGWVTNAQGDVWNTIRQKEQLMKPFTGAISHSTRVILSVGSSMDSGKTTTAAKMVQGFSEAGYRVAFIKLTGTIYTKDCDLVYDHGAAEVADFGLLGYPSTYLCTATQLLGLYETLMHHIKAQDKAFVVIEIADGLYQRETEMLLRNRAFMNGIDAVVYSAGDSLSAIQGYQVLRDMHIVPVALSGLFTASPLLVKEVSERLYSPVLSIDELARGVLMQYLEMPMSVSAS
ncbi:MAG: DUF1611 domain-containing protein [Chitinophagaceae bacterium]|jgi:hypothetical protein|nr:DUF1611 domain-containing protein [Chitinophagaceae bacterium]